MTKFSDDKFTTLRRKYSEEITVKESEVRVIREKLNLLDELLADANSLDLPLGSNEYAGVGLTAAVLTSLQKTGTGGARVSTIRENILQNGFSSEAKNLNSSLSVTLKRLEKSGKVKTERKDGKKYFSLKHD